VPPTPSPAQVLASFKPQEKGDAGEIFDPSYDNLDSRTRLRTFGDLKVALLPKKNRGQTVNVAMTFRWGTRKLAAESQHARRLAMAMLARGTRQLSRQQIADEITRLKVRGRLTHFETTRDKLPEALRLVAQMLQRPQLSAGRVRGTQARVPDRLQSQLDSPEDCRATP
jgi:zinc protease